MQVFLGVPISDKQVRLEEEESKHLQKVLRKKVGDEVAVCDGKGSMFQCEIEELQSKETVLQILSSEFKEAPLATELFIAPTKNMNRMEWLMEKAVELGVTRLQLMICEHSERTKLRIERLQKIAVAAMKQSLRHYLPEIGEPKSFKDCIALLEVENSFLAHCRDEQTRTGFQNKLKIDKPSTILIGPEGDFSTREIDLANSLGIQSVHLGQERLRTETAALYALAVIKSKREQ